MSESLPFATPESLLEAIAPTTAAAAVVLVHDAVSLGQMELAAGLLDASLVRFGSDPGLLLAKVALRARAGRFEELSGLLAEVQRRAPQCLISAVYDIKRSLPSSSRDELIDRLLEVVRCCPDYPGVAGMLATALMPGPGYRDVLRVLQEAVAPRAYLEIGVETGATLALSRAKRTIGIDPDHSPLNRAILPNNCALFECESERFFAEYEPRQVLEDQPLDLVFIDGLHQFDAVIADFAAAERWAHPKTVVVMHDALPVAKVYAARQRRTRFWVGDVWKAPQVLLKTRRDLRVRIIATPPSGLVVITQLCPGAQRTVDDYREALTEMGELELADRVPAWPAEFPVVANNSAGYAEALGYR